MHKTETDLKSTSVKWDIINLEILKNSLRVPSSDLEINVENNIFVGDNLIL